VFSLFLILFCDTTSSECTQLAPCICALPDYYYNLTGLADAELVDHELLTSVLVLRYPFVFASYEISVIACLEKERRILV